MSNLPLLANKRLYPILLCHSARHPLLELLLHPAALPAGMNLNDIFSSKSDDKQGISSKHDFVFRLFKETPSGLMVLWQRPGDRRAICVLFIPIPLSGMSWAPILGFFTLDPAPSNYQH